MYFPTQAEKGESSQNADDNRNIIRIRSVCITPVNADMEDAIKTHFTQFGAVEFVEMHQKNDTHCGLVQFKMAEAAAVALSNVTHRIANCDVTVKPADPSEQPDFILNALDDDCLRAVFRYLGPKDLSNTADVCQRFNKQANAVFSSMYRHFKIYEYAPLPLFCGGMPSEDVERVLRIFGSSIQLLRIQASIIRDLFFFLRLIGQHCTSKLKVLSLLEFEYEDNSLYEKMSRNGFDKLEKLELIRCNSIDFNVLFGGCLELKSLYIEGYDFNSEFIEQQIGKLEEARFIGASWLSEDSFHRFIALNPTLTKISVTFSPLDTICSANAIRCIVQNLPNLVDLELDSLNLHSLPVAPLMNALAENDVPIEQLKLKNGEINNEAIKSMSLLKQMKNLELNYINDFTDEHLIELAKELQQLQELRIEYSKTVNFTTITLKKMLSYATKLSHLTLMNVGRRVEVNAEDYKTLLAIGQNRPEKVHLLIEIIGPRYLFSEYDSIGTTPVENRDWFHITNYFDWCQSEYDYESDYYDMDFDDYDMDSDF